MNNKQWLLGLLVASLVLWLMFLGNLPLRDWDEGTYAIVAREIYRTGNWVYPTIQGDSFFIKTTFNAVVNCYLLSCRRNTRIYY